jgi:uncharacterized protein (TIGR04255 family)
MLVSKLKTAPLYFTLGQVQHNPVLDLGSFLPSIQESMRKSGYPDFKQGQQFSVQLPQLGTQSAGQNLPPVVQKIDRFVFLNLENTRSFVMLPNALSFQTTDYDTFDPFFKELRHGLQVLDEAIGGLSFVERLGLRYLDAVVPRTDETMKQYIASELTGLPALLTDSDFAYSFAESVLIAAKVGRVVSRTIIQSGPLGLPPDLQQLDGLKLLQRFQNFHGEHAVIDTDASLTERRPFDLGDVDRCMKGLHDLVDKTFDATVTDHARHVWNN